jgi:predicted dehydrogenase
LAPDPRRRAAFVGTGHRAELYFAALLGDHADAAVPVALCDPNPTRIAYYRRLWQTRRGSPSLAAYDAAQFTAMLDDQHPDVVIVTTVDHTHAGYVAAALEHGCDVICEKPLTTDLDGCRTVVDAAERSAAELIVTFNYRYSPRNSKVKELVAGESIGTVTSVHFEWLLDTVHGADYFRRWHRDRANSGGLLVHKSTHHFDLVNWWLDDRPESVSAHAALRFYGAANAGSRGEGTVPDRDDPFTLDLAADERLSALYLDAEADDGYVRNADVFSEGITIDDNMAVLARYRTGALLTYSLHAHAPWEGYRVALNGTAGRIELDVVERALTVPPGARCDGVDTGSREAGTRLTLQRHWAPAARVPVGGGDGDHGGGDALMLADLFGPPSADPLGRRAGYHDGINSVLVGIAANESAASGQPVRLDELGVGVLDPANV